MYLLRNIRKSYLKYNFAIKGYFVSMLNRKPYCILLFAAFTNNNPVALVRERTIPTASVV
jgi:hypothetical protein